MSETGQEFADRFYWRNGPCCAGCDWWARINGIVGECQKSAPSADTERGAMLGIVSVSLPPRHGHVLTPREHHCGDFKDDFDWGSLPLAYLKRIGAALVVAPREERKT